MKKYLDYIFSDAILFGVVGWIYYSEYFQPHQNIDLRFSLMIVTVILLNISMVLELRQKEESKDILPKVLWGIVTLLMFVEILLQ